MTFFRQIGGTVALAFVGTIFGSAFADQLVPQLLANGVPQPLITGIQRPAPAFDYRPAARAWVTCATNLAAIIPPQFQSYIPNIIEGIHGGIQPRDGSDLLAGCRGSHRGGRGGSGDQGDTAPLRQYRSRPCG